MTTANANLDTLLPRPLVWLLLAGFTALAISDFYLAFASPTFYMGHDEAEHLHVVFALSRGERPYLDFIENHPVLLHALLAKLLDGLHFDTTMQLYVFVKALIAVHCIGCFLIFACGTRQLLRTSATNCLLLFLIAVAALGVWENAGDGAVRTSNFIWQLRPDWIAYFYAALSLYLYHHSLLAQIDGARRHVIPLLILAGISGGFSLAILAKGIYLFIPYAVTLVAVVIANPRENTSQVLRACWRRLLCPHAVFTLSLLLTLYGSIMLELYLTKVDFSSYYKANFSYNAGKHILFAARDGNPANVVAGLSGLGLLGTVTLLLFVLTATLRLYAKGRMQEFSTLLFCANCIFLNAILPAYSNGLTWVHYFIPSLLAFTALYAYVIATAARGLSWLSALAKEHYSNRNIVPPMPLERISVIATMTIALAFLLLQASAAYDRYSAKIFTSDLYRTATKSAVREFLPDLYLPSDLVYLTFQPNLKPARARTWGYYFMLFADRQAQRTMRDLGLAPELVPYWQALLKASPPDVILSSGHKDMQVHAMLTDIMGNGDISWLWPELAARYSCRHRLSMQILVRNDLLYRFPTTQWRDCSKDTPESLNDTY